MAKKVIVEVVGDTSSYERALARSSKATKAFEADVGKTTTASQGLRGLLAGTGFNKGALLFGSSAFVGTAIASDIIKTTVSAASDLNEQLSRTQVILGDSSDAMIAWSKTTASSMGISQRAALAASATFAGLFQVVGVSTPKAGELSRSLVKLGADLASLQNSTPEEALTALRSGLAGEAEPLRRFNIFLTEARVQQEALAETGKTATSALTQQEKTIARYNLIMKDSVKAQGNFALTSTGLANSQRTLKAETDDLSTSIGSFLIPAMQGLTLVSIEVVQGLNDVIGAMGDFHTKLKETDAFDGWNKGVEDAGEGISGFFKSIGDGIPLLDETIGKVRDLRDLVQAPFDATPGDEFQQPTVVGPRGRAAPGAVAAQATADAQAAAAAIARATRRANLSISQKISESAQRISHLKALIREDPTNAKLQQRLTAEIKTQNNLIAQQKQLNASNAAAVKAAGRAAHDAAVQAAADARDAARAAAERRRERIKARQFQALGLTAEGLKPAPGSGALLQRALGLQDRVKGTVLDTPKTNAQLKRIVNFLKKNFKTAGRDVREAILGMLNDISDAFEGKSKNKAGAKGPLTKTHGLRTAQIIKNLGLTVEQAEEIQRRLAHATTTERRNLSTGAGRTSAPTHRDGGRPGDRVVVESHTTINLDGHQIANVVTRNQQKDKRRNPRQKRGPHRN